MYCSPSLPGDIQEPEPGINPDNSWVWPKNNRQNKTGGGWGIGKWQRAKKIKQDLGKGKRQQAQFTIGREKFQIPCMTDIHKYQLKQ